MPISYLTMTPQQARGGHCTSGGTVASGNAVCECGAWAAAEFSDPESRKVSRKRHLDLVDAMRRPEVPWRGSGPDPREELCVADVDDCPFDHDHAMQRRPGPHPSVMATRPNAGGESR